MFLDTPVSLAISYSLLCNDMLGNNFVSFFCVLLSRHAFTSCSCVIVSGIPPILPLSFHFHSFTLSLYPFHSLSLSIPPFTLSLYNFHSLSLSLSLTLSLSLSLSLSPSLSLSLSLSFSLYPSFYSYSL